MSDLRSEATITLTGIAPAGVFAFIAVQMVVSACIALTIGLSVQAPPALLLILLLAYAFAAPADSGALTSGMTMSANKGATMALHATVASVCQLLAPGALASCSNLAGGRDSASAWLAVFCLLCGSILLGPLALWWSRAAAAG
jgi:hypothetical protein